MLAVHLQPGARKDEVLGLRDGVLWARVAAPPLKGQANRALTKLLAELLGLGTGDVLLLRGHAARRKLIAIKGLSQEELQHRLSQILPAEGLL